MIQLKIGEIRGCCNKLEMLCVVVPDEYTLCYKESVVKSPLTICSISLTEKPFRF